jgi:UDP-glucose 4-epimerase
MGKKILVTGSAGFIGYHLSKSLCSQTDVEVFGIDNFSRYQPDSLYKNLMENPNFTHLELDLEEPKILENLPQFDYVFHLAALNGTANFYERPLEVIRAGILPTLSLLEFFKLKPPKKIIYAGTSESYAGAVDMFNYPVPTSEQVPLVIADVKNPRWSYAASKSLSEVAIATSAVKIGYQYNVVRFHNVYGPRMGFSHVIPELTLKAKRGDFNILGARNIRSFIYIEDAVAALLLLLTDDSLINQIVNIGTEELIEIRDLALRIHKIIGIKSDIKELESPEGSVLKRCPDTTKIRSIGFKSNIDLDKGLALTVQYYLGIEI